MAFMENDLESRKKRNDKIYWKHDISIINEV